MSKEQICSLHDEIAQNARSIWKMSRDIQSSSNIDDISSWACDIESLADQIERTVYSAKERGQAMENRLSDYRNAIENLGFRRI